ncbi:hypothetical protein ACSBR2_007333 [Camellia fascicularis]
MFPGPLINATTNDMVHVNVFDNLDEPLLLTWSATVDSDLFSRYFGRCAVITAQGQTHPVSTHFLKDIYESINYRLASDSPAYLRDDTSTKKNDLVSNHRGKKNLVLCGWGDESILSEDFINPYYIPKKVE